LLGVLVAISSSSSSIAAPAATLRPNIILILADDLGYGDLGCYGQQRIKTPHLDRMASEGLRFTHGYAGAPVCAPSRCVLMTGYHVGHARVRGNTEATKPGAALHANDVTVARVLNDAGYATGLIGKWGLGEPQKNQQGLPRRQGFDYFFGYLKQGHAHNYYTDHLWRNESKIAIPNVISKDLSLKRNVAVKRVQYSHDLFADDALKFVRDHKDHPFFLHLAFTVPHANNEAGDKGMEVPDYGEYADLDWPEPQRGHAAMISRMDRDIGRLLKLLDELGIDENTLVIFTSDNGPHREGGNDADFNDSNGPLRGYKGNVTDGGIRVPLIARWPNRVPAGATSDSPVYFADIMPTLATLGRGSAPTGIDGVDICPTLFGQNQPELSNRFMYWEFNKDGVLAQSARWGRWKAVRDPKTNKLELYDMTKDASESRNLAAMRPDIIAKFVEYFRTARSDSSDWPMAAQATARFKPSIEGAQ
jgi:arylsulfatase A-like enzyme